MMNPKVCRRFCQLSQDFQKFISQPIAKQTERSENRLHSLKRELSHLNDKILHEKNLYDPNILTESHYSHAKLLASHIAKLPVELSELLYLEIPKHVSTNSHTKTHLLNSTHVDILSLGNL